MVNTVPPIGDLLIPHHSLVSKGVASDLPGLAWPKPRLLAEKVYQKEVRRVVGSRNSSSLWDGIGLVPWMCRCRHWMGQA